MPDLGWLVQPAAFPWFAFAFGLCVGSFLNVVIHRLPKMMERDWRTDCAELMAGETPGAAGETPGAAGETPGAAGETPGVSGHAPPEQKPYNLVVPRSACPGCGRGIRAVENIPVLSWLALRGKCAGCGARISLRYPLVELLAGAGAAWSAWHFGYGAAAFGAMLFVWCTIALAFIDHETGYLPDDITLPLLWAGLLLNLAGTFVPLQEAVIGAAAGYMTLWTINAAFHLIRGMDGMGYGDFKMTAAAGAFVGWKYLFLVILLSSCVGLVFGVLQMIAARRGWDAAFRFHFGPYIAIAGVAALLWGQAILAVVPALRPF